MKNFVLSLLLIFSISPVMAEEINHDHHVMHLRQVQPEYVCMVNDTAFEKPQIPVEANGKTYYGCCSMCEARLKNDPAIRMATDPVFGKEIDKAEAIIGADSEGHVFYFETEENMHAFIMDKEPMTVQPIEEE